MFGFKTVEQKISDSAINHGYQIDRKLGNGAFGVAFLVIKVATKEKYVMKVIQCTGQAAINNAQNEARFHDKVGDHPHIVKNYETWFEPQVGYLFGQSTRGGAFLINQFCSKGPFVPKANYNPSDVYKWTLQLLDALRFLHSEENAIIHRDIKPDNLFLDSNSNLVVGDLGIGIMLDSVAADRPNLYGAAGNNLSFLTASTRAGTGLFMAPEVWDASYKRRADVWSAGMSIFCILHDQFLDFKEKGEDKRVFGVLVTYKNTSYPLGVVQSSQLNATSAEKANTLTQLFAKVQWPAEFPILKILLMDMLNPDKDTRLSSLQLIEKEKEEQRKEREKAKANSGNLRGPTNAVAKATPQNSVFGFIVGLMSRALRWFTK